MSKSIKESKYGSLVITTDDTFEKNNDINKNIVFLMKDKSIQKGVIRMSGKFNDCLYVYGIEMDNSIPFCVDDTFKKENKIQCKYMIFMQQSLDFLEIDKENNFVIKDKIEDDANGTYEKGTWVLVRFKHTYKAAIIKKAGTINGLCCYEIQLPEHFCGENNYTMLEVDVVSKLLNDKGFILVQDNLELIPDDDVHSAKVGSEYDHETYKGTVKWKGRVNGLACVGLDTDDREFEDFTKFSKQKNSFWCVIPVDQSCANLPNTSISYDDSDTDSKTSSQVMNSPNSNGRKDCLENEDLIFQYPLYKIETSELKYKIKDKDTRMIYTTVNAMFLASEIFDNLIFREPEICKYLASKIVSPLRRNEEPGEEVWTKFTERISNGNRGSDNDIVQQMLSSIKSNIKLSKIGFKEEEELSFINLSLTDITKLKSLKWQLNEILNMHFLKEDKFILKTPKYLILMFSPNRDDNISVFIPQKLDISKLILTCNNSCSVCSSNSICFCKECSSDKKDIFYFCKDHKIHCKHEKKDLERNSDELSKDNIILDLVSIICKNKDNYNSYVKTIEVNENWMNFSINDDGKVEKRDVDLSSYFTKSNWSYEGNNNKHHAENLEKNIYMCIYKYAPLEFYWNYS